MEPLPWGLYTLQASLNAFWTETGWYSEILGQKSDFLDWSSVLISILKNQKLFSLFCFFGPKFYEWYSYLLMTLNDNSNKNRTRIKKYQIKFLVKKTEWRSVLAFVNRTSFKLFPSNRLAVSDCQRFDDRTKKSVEIYTRDDKFYWQNIWEEKGKICV